MNCDIVYRTERKIVYKVPSISCITGEFIQSLAWPPGITGVIFLFNQQISDEHRILSALPLDLDVGMVYSAMREALPVGKIAADVLIEQIPVQDEEQLSRLYLICRERVMAPVISARTIPPVDKSAVLLKLKKQLSEGKVALWAKAGDTVGALALTRWHDFADNPVQWIPWVWVSDELLPVERRILHAQILNWLKLSVDNKVQCVVDSYNVRSQKFFRKLGFTPECLHIVKS